MGHCIKWILIGKPGYARWHFNDYKINESIIALVVSGLDYKCLFVEVHTIGTNPDERAGALLNRYQIIQMTHEMHHFHAYSKVAHSQFLSGLEIMRDLVCKTFLSRNPSAEQRIANYGISRKEDFLKIFVEILGKKWLGFRVSVFLALVKIKGITLAALTLHSWLRADSSSRNIYCM